MSLTIDIVNISTSSPNCSKLSMNKGSGGQPTQTMFGCLAPDPTCNTKGEAQVVAPSCRSHASPQCLATLAMAMLWLYLIMSYPHGVLQLVQMLSGRFILRVRQALFLQGDGRASRNVACSEYRRGHQSDFKIDCHS